MTEKQPTPPMPSNVGHSHTMPLPEGKSSTPSEQILMANNFALNNPQSFNPLKDFETGCREHPDAIAVVQDDQHMTYAELNRLSTVLGDFLRQEGIGPEKIVGLFLERSVDLIVGILGVIKAGGGILPMEPSYPKDRIHFILHDTKPQMVLTHSYMKEHVLPPEVEAVDLDTFWNHHKNKKFPYLKSGLMKGNISVVFYTSGSTGNPKGVMEIHRTRQKPSSDSSQAQEIGASIPSMDHEDRILVKCPISFAPSFWEILEPLAVGGSLILAKPGGEQNFSYLTRLICEEQITMMHAVPSGLRQFLEQPTITSCVSVKRIICSGEFLSEKTRQRLFDCLDTNIYFYYAATEAPGATILHLHRGNRRQPLTFGDGHREKVYILGPNFNLTTKQTKGEVFVETGDKVRGYLGQPGLTAKKFVPDPLSQTPGSRLYRTGDLACYQNDGSIKILGREDFQIKLRGIRIELGEIESVLRQQQGIADAVVLLRERTEELHHLVAFLLPEHPSNPEIQTFPALLRAHIPESMIPTNFKVLEAFPLTPNGKVDREALSAKLDLFDLTNHDFQGPRNPIESFLTEIWENVLSLERVGVHDNFFELGGNSLLATQVVSQLRNVLELDFPLRNLFEHPTIEQFSREIDAQLTNTNPDWSDDEPQPPASINS